MKKIFLLLLTLSFAGIIIFISCKKEKSCEGCINGNRPPTAVAGPDQVITLPTDSVSLDGSVSSDPDGTISNWLWTKISGPASFNIINSTTAKTVIKNLTAGSYQFELKVTDNGGLSAKDTMTVTVDATQTTNHPPIANAGTDQIITLPTNNVTIDGTGSTDPDNNITSYAWTKISGPVSFNITNPNTVQTQLTNLVQGIYLFELKVTDAGGLFSKDTMQLTVNAQPPPSICDSGNRPQVNAQLIPVGNLSQARTEMAVASAGNKIVFAGGMNAVYHSSSRVDIYDIATQAWSTAELSVHRTDIAAVAAGNKIFFGGGEVNDTTTSPVDNVDIYDVSTNTWTVTHLSKAGFSMAATAVGNKVFFAGGYNRGDPVDIYDLTTSAWSLKFLSSPRSWLSAVTANGKVYFAGGLDQGDQISGALPTIDIYDNATDSWSTSALSEGKMGFAGIAVDNRIYWAGGYSNNGLSCAVEIKDINTGNSSIQYLFNPAFWNLGFGQNGVVKDNKIIFYRPNGTTDSNRFDIYDIATNSWSIGVLPQLIPNGASIISVNNTIYIAGGSVNGVLSNQVWKLEF